LGCAAVHALLHDEKLDRYYDLRGPVGRPVVAASRRADKKWLEGVAAGLAAGDAPTRIELDIQGMHCSACVWLIEQLFRKEKAGGSILVNPAVGRITLTVGRAFPLREFVARIESVGYIVGAKAKTDASPARELLGRFGLSVALSMNAMIFSVAIYAGLATGPLRHLFDAIDCALATLVVLIGGTVFFRSAFLALKQRAVHLDLPIALGIASSYAGSVHAFANGRPPYFDTLCVFVTLMVLGRFLQERVLEKNQRQLLSDAGTRSLLTRRQERDHVRVVPCTDLAAGDELVIAVGDLVPVDAVLLSARGECSLDWINGESSPRSFVLGDTVPGGAFNAGRTPLEVRAKTGFEDSPVTHILRTPSRCTTRHGRSTLLRWLAPIYVSAVLVLAAGAFALWLHRSRDLGRALEVATAMLVVTCPCAFGIATPLAYELVLAGLRRRGLFVRSADFLDKASRVHRVVFDKTGTLTEGALSVTHPEGILALGERERAILLALATASTHPKSEAIRAWLTAHACAAAILATEVEGRGVEACAEGAVYRLGAPEWATAPFSNHSRSVPRADADVVFSRDGVPLAAICTSEMLRAGAAREVESLRRDGYGVWMLSGDAQSRVDEIARAVGIDVEHAIGGCGASDKASWLSSHDRQDTLMIGDGINDLVAVATAFCSGTPAVDRPFVASRSDFYYVSPGLGPIRAALSASRALSRVVQRNLGVAIAYNLIAVSLVLAGLMSPLLCAVWMPASSLSAILTTTLSLSERSSAWRC
jgi:Cu2+-exporting ATPase